MGALLYIVKGLLTAAFLMAGGAKLAAAKPLADQFHEFGLPLGLMRVIAVLEIAGAIGLWVEPFPVWAALGLAGLMVGALVNHFKVKHTPSKSAPAFVLLVLSAFAAAGLWWM